MALTIYSFLSLDKSVVCASASQCRGVFFFRPEKELQRNFKEKQKCGLIDLERFFILPTKTTGKQKKQSTYHLLSPLLHKKKGYFNSKESRKNIISG